MISEIPEIKDGRTVSACICSKGHTFNVSWECRTNAIYCPKCNERVEA
ncbi:hypothetical protein [Methanolobus sp.]|nr:hypothetical protein [Methanolobus sp.]